MNARWLAWSLFGLFVGLATATPVLVVVRHGNAVDALVAIGIGFALVGALVASRQPANAVGWLLLVAAVALGIDTFTSVYLIRASLPGTPLAAWLNSWLYFVWLYLPALFLTLVFPTGRLLSRRWRVVVWLGVSAVAVDIICTAFAPGDLDISAERPIRNPLGIGGPVGDALPSLFRAGDVLAAGAVVLGGLSLVLRLRRSRGRERQQVKWFAYVSILALVPFSILALVSLVAGDDSPPWNVVVIIAWWSLVALVLVGLPAAIGVAILRHQLYDIDVVINRTLVYGALTLTLGASYLGSVLLLQLLLRPVTQGSGPAVAVSTLAVAALFRPARRRIQLLVDRRFFRRRYDAARTLEAFGSRLRDQLDVDALGNDLQVVVRDTMQPTQVSLWLRGSR
jgi:hypothetical protein